MSHEIKTAFFWLQIDLGNCDQIFSIPSLTVATEYLRYSMVTQRRCSFDLCRFISFPKLVTGPTHPPQYADRISTIERKGKWLGPTCIIVMSQRVWADNILQRLIRDRASCNVTPKVVLTRVDCGHCGCLITGGSAVMVPSWVKAWWDVGSGSGCSYQNSAWGAQV